MTVFLSEHELKVGTHHAEGLVDVVATAGLDHHLVFGLLFFLAEETEDALPQRGFLAVVWDLTYKWCGEVFEIFASTHAGVHVLTDEEDDQRDEQAEGDGHQEDVTTHGTGGEQAAHRGCDDAGVVGGEGLGELVLLSLLEEEEVELLLDALLTLYAKQVLCLGRVASDAGGAGCRTGSIASHLGIEGADLVVDGGDDSAALLVELGIEVLHEWVLLTGVGHEGVALQELLVVGSYLLLDGGVVDT